MYLKNVRRAVPTLVIALAVFWLPVCSFSTVENHSERRWTSPDGKLDAVLYIRDGGATTGWTTCVSILRKGARLPDEIGNVVIFDGHYDGYYEGGPGQNVLATWKSARVLSVEHKGSYARLKSHDEVAGVRIEYSQLK